jgi:hypothetical protein
MTALIRFEEISSIPTQLWVTLWPINLARSISLESGGFINRNNKTAMITAATAPSIIRHIILHRRDKRERPAYFWRREEESLEIKGIGLFVTKCFVTDAISYRKTARRKKQGN